MMLSTCPLPQAAHQPVERQSLLAHALWPDDLRTLAFAGVIGESLRKGMQPLIRGITDTEFQRLMHEFFPDLELSNGKPYVGDDLDEFTDLVDLLMEHATDRQARDRWLSCTIATAAMHDEHLWQDMGLPSRRELTALLNTFFTSLAAKNVNNMKWKKFFYRQLCEKAGVMICRSPRCADCGDYQICFGEE